MTKIKKYNPRKHFLNFRLKKIISITLFMCIYGFLNSQDLNKKIDSLDNLISKSQTVTERLEYLVEQGQSYFENDKYDETEKISNKILNTATKINDYRFIGEAYYLYARVKYERGDIQNALDLCFDVVAMSDNFDNYRLMSNVYFEIGYIYTKIGMLKQAIDYLVKSNEMLPDKGNEVEKAKTINNIGYLNELIGEYETALIHYRQALGVFEEFDDKKAASYVYNNIGALYREMDRFEEAIEYYNLSYKMKLEIGDSSALATTYNNLGVVYEKQLKYDSALINYRLALRIAKRYNMKHNEARTTNNIGRIKELQGDFDSALVYYFESFNMKEKLSDNHGKILSYLNIGSVYANNNKYDSSVFYYNKGIEIADSLNFVKELASLYQEISFSYEKLADYKIALDYYKKYSEISDTLLNSEKQKRIDEMEIVYQTEKKEEQLSFLQKENLAKEKIISRNRLLIFLVLFSAILFGLLFYSLNKRQKLSAKHKAVLIEQKLLRTQMNPHFMFNSLSSIQAFIYENEPLKAGKYISDFAKLMRLILDNSRSEAIVLKKEIETLEYYLKLQQLRFNYKFDYKIDIDKNINPEIIYIPPMLAQPIIENAIEHGIKKISKQGLITINYKKVEKGIAIEIIDNGLGLNQKGNGIHEGSKSYALQITNERLASFFKNGEKYVNLNEIFDENGNIAGTKAEFIIPVKKKKDVKNNNN